MTNNINTLNGALSELGESMADNLVTMGVTDADASDGLTTLANKILDVPVTPVTPTLTLTANKQILSSYNSDTLTLTATLTGGTVSGQTIEFYNGLTSMGTAQTNSQGVATMTYSSSGVGDIVFSATGNNLTSQSITVEDCNYWNTAEVSRTTTQGSTIYDSNLSQTLPSKCEISYDMSADNVTTASERRCFVLPKSQFSSGTTQPSYALFSQIGGSKLIVATRNNSSNVNDVPALTSVTNNQYYNVKFIRDGTTVSRYVNDVKVDDVTVNFLDNYTDWTVSMIRWSATGTSKIRNVKFKSLGA